MRMAGIVAGPLYVIGSLIEMFTRDGFDPRRNAWSEMSNGPWGWIHSTLLIVSGLLVVLAAKGWRNRATPFLAVYGLGMVVAGIFTADAHGQPISTSGLVHFAAGGVGFIALIIACFLMKAKAVGVIFTLTYIALIAGRGQAWSLLTFTAGVILVSAWITVATLKLEAVR